MEQVRPCSRCSTTKPCSAFGQRKDGTYKGRCRDCCSQSERERRQLHGDHVRALEKAYRDRDVEGRLAVERRAYAKRALLKAADIRANRVRWERANRQKTAAWSAVKRARRHGAAPRWLTVEQRAEIAALYRLAAKLSSETGDKHHVDHIEPVAGADVCGLHVPWNLQVIPATANQAKGNRRIAA
jgi:hypothetical protein